MALYGILHVESGDLLSILAAHRFQNDSGEVTSDTRYVTVTGALQVGRYFRQPLFVTSDLDLVRFMLATGFGNEYSNDIALDRSNGDLAIVDVATMAVVDPGPPDGDLKRDIERVLEASAADA